MATRAKFRLTGVKKYETQQWIYDREHPSGYVPPAPFKVADLTFSAVGHSKNPNDEDNYFFASTPSGSISLSVVNPDAVVDMLEGLGKEFYVTFEVAPGQENLKPQIARSEELHPVG